MQWCPSYTFLTRQYIYAGFIEMQNLKVGKNIQPKAGIYPGSEFPIILDIKLFSSSANKLCFNFFLKTEKC